MMLARCGKIHRRLIPSIVAILLFSVFAAAQTARQPARRDSDVAVITTGENIAPAGVQSTFQERAFGVTFGETSDDIWVLTASGLVRLSWTENRVLGHFGFDGSGGLQSIQYDSESHRPLIGYTKAVGSVGCLNTVEGGKMRMLSDRMGTSLLGALALAPKDNLADQRIVVLPLTTNNRLAIFDLKDYKLLGMAQTGVAPFGAAINSVGTVAYVSNWGGRPPRPQDSTAASGSDQVVVDQRGIASTGTVSRIDLASQQSTHSIDVGLHPTALVWDEAHERLFVANGNSDTVSVINTTTNQLIDTLEIRPFREKAHGIAPTALAVSSDGSRLFVACGGINAIAVYDVVESTLLGLVPTAWYPNGISLSRDGKYLAVTALLGIGSGSQNDDSRKHYVHAYRGSVNVLPIPDGAQLAEYTTIVARNNRSTLDSRVARSQLTRSLRNVQPTAIPQRPGESSLIENVVFIIKENRTYDSVFGDIAKGNGDPSLVEYGEATTPNQHRLAEGFVLLDNFYATGGNSVDGHQWLTQANETDYGMWPGYAGRSYPFDGTDPMAYSNGGFIWDAAIAKRQSVVVMGEFAGSIQNAPPGQRVKFLEEYKQGRDFTSRINTVAPLAPLNRILVKNYPAFGPQVPDVVRAQIFLNQLKGWEKEGRMPNLVITQLPSDHTEGLGPNKSSPAACVADNDLALGQIVEGLSKSQFWKKMAIFVVEDDAQDAVDHVDGHRTVALAISPYIKRGSVDSTFYAHQSMLKTIELILGIPPLTIFDLIATDMRASFTEKADYTPYVAVMPRQSIYEVNPPLSALKGKAKAAALASLRMRFDIPDAAPTDRLNRMLWHTARGWRTPYPGVSHSAFFPMSRDIADDR